jgi:hypothetical protein
MGRLSCSRLSRFHPQRPSWLDGRHKARLVADGHLADEPLESTHSGAISFHGVHLLLFIAELNDLETWTADVGNVLGAVVTGVKSAHIPRVIDQCGPSRI